MGLGKCCMGLIVCQLISLTLLALMIPAGYLVYNQYLKEWGAKQLRNAPSMPSTDDITNGAHNIHVNWSSPGLSCPKCSGVNYQYPITGLNNNYTSFEIKLMNDGGHLVSGLTAASFGLTGASIAVSVGTSIMASSSGVMTSASSQGISGVHEVSLLIGQAQFVTLLGSMNLGGMPQFFMEFCKDVSWANLQFFSEEGVSTNKPGRRLAVAQQDLSVHGVARYAQTVGVSPDHLFYYTELALLCVLAGILLLFALVKIILRLMHKSDSPFGETINRRVIWVIIQFLLLVQYALAMTATFQIYYSTTSHSMPVGLALAIFILASLCVGVVLFGVIKIARHKGELEDVGTHEHEQKPFNHKYGAYYQDFTKSNKYFFVLKCGLDIGSGAVIGMVQDVLMQIAWLIGLNALYVVALLIRRPFIVKLFFHVGIVMGFFRIILLFMTMIQAHPDKFPQQVRDIVAMIIVGVNAVLFICVLVRQLYIVLVGTIKFCKNRNRGHEEMHDEIDPDENMLMQPHHGSKPYSVAGNPNINTNTNANANANAKAPLSCIEVVTPPVETTPPTETSYRLSQDPFAHEAALRESRSIQRVL